MVFFRVHDFFSKNNILSRKIWQRMNIHRAFLKKTTAQHLAYRGSIRNVSLFPGVDFDASGSGTNRKSNSPSFHAPQLVSARQSPTPQPPQETSPVPDTEQDFRPTWWRAVVLWWQKKERKKRRGKKERQKRGKKGENLYSVEYVTFRGLKFIFLLYCRVYFVEERGWFSFAPPDGALPQTPRPGKIVSNIPMVERASVTRPLRWAVRMCVCECEFLHLFAYVQSCRVAFLIAAY